MAATCIFHNSYFESDEFLAFALHTLTSIEIPMHLLGSYLIIFKTPKTMRTAKNRILQLHISCIIMDLMITSLWGFFMWMPLPAGYPVGLMTKIGLGTEIQAWLAINSMLAVALSYLSLFENRYDTIVIGQIGRSKCRDILRILYFSANIIYVEGYIGFVFWNLSSQERGRKRVKDYASCIPSNLVDNPYFINLNADTPIIPTLTCIMVVVVCVQILYFVLFTSYYLFFKVSNVSKQTRQMQKKFFVSTLLQTVIPAISYAAPLFACYLIWVFYYYNQVFNNLIMIVIGCNGLSTTIVMIVVHHPYRSALMDMCSMTRFQNLRNPVATTNINMFAKHDLVLITS